MITKETANRVWNHYHEIEKAEQLIADVREQLNKTGDPHLIDAFGRKSGMQFGVPMGDNGHRLYDVRPVLAEMVILDHIKHNQEALKDLEKVIVSEMIDDTNVDEIAKRLENGHDYLMAVMTDKITVEDTLEAFGFGRNGLES